MTTTPSAGRAVPGRLNAIGSVPRREALAGLLALLIARPGRAGSLADPLRLRYVLTTAGVPVGEMTLEAIPRGELIETRFEFTSGGLLDLLNGRSETRLRAQTRVVSPPAPVEFEGTYEKPDRKRRVRLAYAADGRLLELSVRSGGRERGSDVPPALRDGSMDPLTAFHRARAWMADASARQSPLALDVLDARKLLTLELHAEDDAGQHFAARLLPKAGFDDGDLATGDDQRWYEVVVSTDGRYVPMRIRSRSGLPLAITAEP